jgi:hypothetical protein
MDLAVLDNVVVSGNVQPVVGRADDFQSFEMAVARCQFDAIGACSGLGRKIEEWYFAGIGPDLDPQSGKTALADRLRR